MKLSDKVLFLVARKDNRSNRLHYYFRMGNGKLEYVCTKKYSSKCYEICRSGIPLNDLLYHRKGKMKDRDFENLVNYIKYLWPYFQEEYGFAA